MKEAIQRFDQTLAAAANSGVQEFVELAACITQIMQYQGDYSGICVQTS